MTDKMERFDGTLPARYSGTSREHIHLRITGDMARKLWADKRLTGGPAQRIRYILERYLSRE